MFLYITTTCAGTCIIYYKCWTTSFAEHYETCISIRYKTAHLKHISPIGFKAYFFSTLFTKLSHHLFSNGFHAFCCSNSIALYLSLNSGGCPHNGLKWQK